MMLSRLVEPIKEKQWVVPQGKGMQTESNPDVTSVHYRSQSVLPGGIFIAIKGFSADGHQFIDDAIRRGACAVIAEQVADLAGAVLIKVANTRKALAVVSSRFYKEPSLTLKIIGVTGTNGKTTTSYIIENILKKAHLNVGVISTINYRYGEKTFDNPMTTPESLELQKILSEMAENNVTHVVMEVSSHALDLCRVDECWFDVGVFTNLTQDHLDFHEDMAAYWLCKKRFFTDILASGPKRDTAVAVINCNDANGKELFDNFSFNKISVGSMDSAMICSIKINHSLAGIEGLIHTPAGDLNIRSGLVGSYNVENILCAAGSAVALNISKPAIEAGINTTSTVPGRLEAVTNTLKKYVYIDYAHTPDALENALQTLEEIKTGRIITVFGCGGNRDKGKRAKMGEIAGRFSDVSVITTDNPRKEDPMEIIEEIEKGIKKTAPRCFATPDFKSPEKDVGRQYKGYLIISDRKKAIREAIDMAKAGDIILIAGKGHETYQIMGDRVLEFDDKKVAQEVLQSREEALLK